MLQYSQEPSLVKQYLFIAEEYDNNEWGSQVHPKSFPLWDGTNWRSTARFLQTTVAEQHSSGSSCCETILSCTKKEWLTSNFTFYQALTQKFILKECYLILVWLNLSQAVKEISLLSLTLERRIMLYCLWKNPSAENIRNKGMRGLYKLSISRPDFFGSFWKLSDLLGRQRPFNAFPIHQYCMHFMNLVPFLQRKKLCVFLPAATSEGRKLCRDPS